MKYEDGKPIWMSRRDKGRAKHQAERIAAAPKPVNPDNKTINTLYKVDEIIYAPDCKDCISDNAADVATRASKQYYNFLSEKHEKDQKDGKKIRGFQKTDVTDLVEFDDGRIMLYLSSKLTDASLTYLEINGKEIGDDHYSYRSYDDNSRTLELSIDDDVRSILNKLKRGSEKFTAKDLEPVKIVTDLKFLVKRIAEFYAIYGEELNLPSSSNASADVFIPSRMTPTENQMEAIRICQESPLSYVWGAPGTGKTQYVLSASIMNDLKKGKKVAVFAPTNASLEQVLHGLIASMKGDAESARYLDLKKDVIRVGMASDEFLMMYPEMCEKRSILKPKKVINATIAALNETREEKLVDSLMDEVYDVKEKLESYDGAEPEYKHQVEAGFDALMKKMKGIDILKDHIRGANRFNMKKTMDNLIEKAYCGSRPRNSIPEYDDYSADDISAIIDDLKRKLEMFSSVKELGTASLESAKLIVATPHQFVRKMCPAGSDEKSGKHVLDVGHIYVDEAGYCNLMQVLTLFTNDCPITLLGDHMQLEPVFEMGRRNALEAAGKEETSLCFMWGMPAIHAEEFFRCSVKGLSSEYKDEKAPRFDKMKRAVLLESHRFGDNLATILDDFVYHTGIRGVSENVLISCLDVSGKPDNRVNKEEAEAIKDLLDEHRGEYGAFKVLSPYVNQVDEINKKCTECAMTIHKSQGREWDTVILSVSDSFECKYFTDSNKSEGLHLINTAVSRAKKHLIIVCDVEGWSGEKQLISALIKEAEGQGNMIC